MSASNSSTFGKAMIEVSTQAQRIRPSRPIKKSPFAYSERFHIELK
jgi:hypothetical protein